MLELLRREADVGVAVAVVTERRDGSVHPIAVDAATLRRRQLALTGRAWLMVDQMHGTAVFRAVDATTTWPVAGTADVAVASTVPVAVWAADCAEIVLFDGDGGVVGCHAGWRGLAAGIVERRRERDHEPDRSGAGAVHPPVLLRVRGDVSSNGWPTVCRSRRSRSPAPRHRVRRRSTCRQQSPRHWLVTASNWTSIGPCTGCDERWFSHRRGDAGRHAVVAWYEAAT